MIFDETPSKNEEDPSNKQQQTIPDTTLIDLGKSLYLVLDLETNGFSRLRDHVIKIAGKILGPDRIGIEDAFFSSLIKPPKQIPQIVVELTGITNDMVKDKEGFSVVISNFVTFVEKVEEYNDANGVSIKNVIFVAHNGKCFDLPFLVDKLKRNNQQKLLDKPIYNFAIDTMILAQKCVQEKSECSKFLQTPQPLQICF